MKAKEIGSEPALEEFIDVMVRVFREVRRVMRPDATLWLNLGSSYASGGQLLNIPHRVAEALRQDGWIWRQTICWAKRCLSGGTWLYARTVKGDAPAMLKDLVRLDPETVQLWNGAKWTQVLGWTQTPATKGSRRRGERTGYREIVLRSGERIGCTAEHRWPTDRGVVFTSELQVGDVIRTCRLPEPEGVQSLCLSDADLGWLCGFYMAEANKTPKGIVFSVHAKETAAYERIRRMAESMGGTAMMQKRTGNAAVIVVYCRAMRELLADFIPGTTSHNKRLGRKAWMRGNEFLRALLDGYLEGDGHWRKDAGQWIVGFCNNDGLATDLRCLCARLDKVCVLRRVKHRCGDKTFPGWRGRIREHSSHHNARPRGEVVAVENSRAREFWDIAVADEPNLFALASGVLSHNSPMPESVKGVRWERCRVKVADKEYKRSDATDAIPAGWNTKHEKADTAGNFSEDQKRVQWQPCPGCDKCRDTGGWVLRRGRGRCTSSFEYIFLMTKSGKYFWDSAGAMEETTANGISGPWGPRGDSSRQPDARTDLCNNEWTSTGSRNMRSVWTLSSEPTSEKHFATFPSELVRRCLSAGVSAVGVCPHCGAPWAPMIERENVATRPIPAEKRQDASGKVCSDPGRHIAVTNCVGYRPTCNCPEHKPIGSLVLDCFAGIGTVGQTAIKLGNRFVGVDLNEKYLKIAAKRIFEPPRWWLRQQDVTPQVKPLDGQKVLFQ